MQKRPTKGRCERLMVIVAFVPSVQCGGGNPKDSQHDDENRGNADEELRQVTHDSSSSLSRLFKELAMRAAMKKVNAPTYAVLTLSG